MPCKSALIIPVLRASRSVRGGFVSFICKEFLFSVFLSGSGVVEAVGGGGEISRRS